MNGKLTPLQLSRIAKERSHVWIVRDVGVGPYRPVRLSGEILTVASVLGGDPFDVPLTTAFASLADARVASRYRTFIAP